MSAAILDLLFWLAVLACAVAQFFIIRAVFKPAPIFGTQAVGDESAAIPRGNLPAAPRWLEVVWAVLPAFFLALAFAMAWQLMHPTQLMLPVLQPSSGL